MSNWNRVFKPIVVLSVICVIITGALAATNQVTAPIIEAATIAAQNAARFELLPEADDFTAVEGVSVENVSDVYVANNGTGAVVTCAAKGYGGTITVMVAFNPDDTVKQIKITEQSETAGLGAKIAYKDVQVLPIFDLIAKEGGISQHDMYNTYNMGVGMSIVVPAEQAEKALEILKANGEDAYVLGEIVAGEEKVKLC